jgi:hypothetical protein
MKNENKKTRSMIVVATTMTVMKATVTTTTTQTTKNQKLHQKIQLLFMKKKRSLKTSNQLNLDSLGKKNSNVLSLNVAKNEKFITHGMFQITLPLNSQF